MRKLDCLRCGAQMDFIMREDVQLGRRGWLVGDWPNLLAGALELDIYACPKCGKVEFFQSWEDGEEGETPQKKCPKCGKTHDFDYPQCPFCKYDYAEEESRLRTTYF